jgi:6-phosphofructokinase 1
VDSVFDLQGFQGLVDNLIEELSWKHVSGIMKRGGTVLGTARCDQFRQREGRLTAAKNMVEHRINNLVVVGGDGSLTGANVFREEWQGLLKELVEKSMC